jgi:hypothetical protein
MNILSADRLRQGSYRAHFFCSFFRSQRAAGIAFTWHVASVVSPSRSLPLPQMQGTHSAVEPVICVCLQQSRLAVSKLQDTRTVTSLGCIETKSSLSEPAASAGSYKWHYTLYSFLPQHTHTLTHTHTQQEFTFSASKFPSKFPSTANSKPWQTIYSPPTGTEPRSANLCPIHQQFWGRITLASSLLAMLEPSKMPAVWEGTKNLWNLDIFTDRVAWSV